VAPSPLAFAWQFALLSRLVFAALPELHPASAGAADRSNTPMTKTIGIMVAPRFVIRRQPSAEGEC
jgi:hypothetical protein